MATLGKILTTVLSASMLFSTAFAAGPPPGGQGQTVETSKLRWKGKTVKVALSSSLIRQNANIKTDSDVVGALKRSFEAWQRAADVDFVLDISDKQNVSASGVAGDGINLITIAQSQENVLFFLKDSDSTSAKTRIFYNAKGFITEADIVLNPFQQFSTDGTFGTYDLESTLTHEIGHMLGLTHSAVWGSTMMDNFGKNGVFGIRDLSPRTLSESDISAVRELYGTPADAIDCCGRVTGKLSSDTNRSVKNLRLWLEETGSGRVVAQTDVANDGSFKFGGIKSGEYTVFSKSKDPEEPTSVANLGTVSLEKLERKLLNLKAEPDQSDISVEHIGYNNQLADFAVPLSPGRSYVIYLGGKNLVAKNLTISFNSPYLRQLRRPIVNLDYGEGISVISFAVSVDPKTPLGDYGVCVNSKNGSQDCLVGGLTVGEPLLP